MHHPATKNAARRSLSAETSPPPLPASEKLESGFWSPDSQERALAAELEKILKHKPVQRISMVSADRNLLQNAGDDSEAADMVIDPLEDTNGDFDWQAHEHTTVTSDAGSALDEPMRSEASLNWVKKASRERRRRMARNALGWSTTLVIGGIIAGCAAYLLTGWQPDLPALLAVGQKIHL